MSEQAMSNADVLARFTSAADRLEAAIRDLSEAELDLASAPGEWTIRAIVHHLTDDGDVWSMCIKKAIATPGALVRFEGFPGNEAWADALDFGRRKIEPGMALIKAHRQYIARLLEDFAAAWDRSVRLADSQGQVVQEMSIREMVGMLAEHMLEHVEAIDTIKKKHGIE